MRRHRCECIPMDTTTHRHKEDQQTFRDFLDNGSVKDERTSYDDGSTREPDWKAEPAKRRPLAPSPFTRGTK